MDLYYIIILAIAPALTIKNESSPKRKRLFIAIYIVLIGLAFAYWAGFSIGAFIYNITNP